MSEADKLKELFDIAWDMQISNEDLGKELARKVMLYIPDIIQQFDYLQSKEEEQCEHLYVKKGKTKGTLVCIYCGEKM